MKEKGEKNCVSVSDYQNKIGVKGEWICWNEENK